MYVDIAKGEMHILGIIAGRVKTNIMNKCRFCMQIIIIVCEKSACTTCKTLVDGRYYVLSFVLALRKLYSP